MSEADKPLVIFMPAELDPSEHPAWIATIVRDLGDAGVVAADNEQPWQAMLAEALEVGLHPNAVAYFLMIMPGAQPVYVWATVGEAPAGRPKELLTSLGNEIAQSFNNRVSQVIVEDAPVEVGLFVGKEKDSDSSALIYLMGAVSSTLTLPDEGDVDVCLWFTSTDLENMPEALPFLAKLIRDPDLLTFLNQ